MAAATSRAAPTRTFYLRRRVLLRLLSQFGYVAITGLLVLGGIGAPVPEEIVQLTAGYLARREILSLPLAIASAYLANRTARFNDGTVQQVTVSTNDVAGNVTITQVS